MAPRSISGYLKTKDALVMMLEAMKMAVGQKISLDLHESQFQCGSLGGLESSDLCASRGLLDIMREIIF